MPRRPNILWICTDEQRWDTIHALGNRHIHTPHVDRLVSEGVAFTHTFCQSPICTASRSSFLTGMYPSSVHGCCNGNERWPGAAPLVTRLLADAGYDCGLAGKLHLAGAHGRIEPRGDDGYRVFHWSHDPRDQWPEGHDYADWVREQGGNLDEMRESEERVPAECHQTTWATERSIEFIQQKRDCPWLLTVNIYDPHPPFIPPKIYADRFDAEAMPGPHFRDSDFAQQAKLCKIDFQDEIRTPEDHNAKQAQANYYAMILQIDDQFARILDVLESTGQRDNTVIIFTSDHGEALGDHGLMFKGCRFYEGLVRVPLIFSWPGRFEANLQSPALVELLDMTATIIELAGLPQPEYMQGQSLLPILRCEAKPDHHRDFVRSEYFDALDTHFTGGTGTFATMYRDERYKITIYHGHEVGELYDLQEDPWEFNNLWDATDSEALKARLIRASFDAHVMLTTDVGSRRIAPM